MSATAKNDGAGPAGIEMSNLSLATDKAPALSRQVSKAGNRHSLLDLHICLPDLSHITLMIDQHTQATEIMDMIIEALGLNSAEARRVLSLWLVSADLELQLKPNHCPTQLFGKWPIYLRKYTTLGEKGILAQKPLVHLRRNVYISRDEDLTVTDGEILELLFTEARCNIMNGTYPCNRDLVIDLAGILCSMQYGPYNENEHTPDFYKSLRSILPLSILSNTKVRDDICNLVSFAHKSADKIDKLVKVDDAASRNDTWFKAAYECYLGEAHNLPYYGANQASIFPMSMLSDSKTLIASLIESLAKKTNTLLNNSGAPRVAYLSACSVSLPYYGSVFFDGFIERATKSFLHSSWLPVSIGANTDGIYIISSENEEPLLGILYEDLTWEYVEVCSCSTMDCPHSERTKPGTDQRQRRVSQKVKSSKKDKVTTMPSLLLQYPARPDEQSEGINFQVLRVYTMSARLIDAFIDNCSEILKQKIQSPIPSPEVLLASAGAGDVVDGPRFSSSTGHSHSETSRNRESLEKSIRSLLKPDKLLCQSFTKDCNPVTT